MATALQTPFFVDLGIYRDADWCDLEDGGPRRRNSRWNDGRTNHGEVGNQSCSLAVWHRANR